MNSAMKMPMPMPGKMMNPGMMMMSPMSAHMSMEMTGSGLQCLMTPAEGVSMAMMADCCAMLNRMMECGMPCMMSCNGMPMMMCCGMPMMPMLKCEMTGTGMSMMMLPNAGMSMDMLMLCREMMNRMLDCGMCMQLSCGEMMLMNCMR